MICLCQPNRKRATHSALLRGDALTDEASYVGPSAEMVVFIMVINVPVPCLVATNVPFPFYIKVKKDII